MRSQWRKRRRHEVAELNITAFMNLMVILVPFLLITAVFSRLAILELNLPSEGQQAESEPETLQLEVIIRADRIEVGGRGQGLMTGLPQINGDYDYAGLTEYLQRIKASFPDKTDATILLEADVPYEVLVQVMDAVRVYEAERAGDRVQAELFPEISIGDAPLAAQRS
jgi:biopolymer transport protein ExbD